MYYQLPIRSLYVVIATSRTNSPVLWALTNMYYYSGTGVYRLDQLQLRLVLHMLCMSRRHRTTKRPRMHTGMSYLYCTSIMIIIHQRRKPEPLTTDNGQKMEFGITCVTCLAVYADGLMGVAEIRNPSTPRRLLSIRSITWFVISLHAMSCMSDISCIQIANRKSQIPVSAIILLFATE